MRKKTLQQEYSKIAAHYNNLFKKMDSGELQPGKTIKWHTIPEGKHDISIVSDEIAAKRHNKKIKDRYNDNINHTEREYSKINIELYNLRKTITDTGAIDIKSVKHLQNEFADMLHSIDLSLGVRIKKGAVIDGKIDPAIVGSHNDFKEYLKEIRPAVEWVLNYELPRIEKMADAKAQDNGNKNIELNPDLKYNKKELNEIGEKLAASGYINKSQVGLFAEQLTTPDLNKEKIKWSTLARKNGKGKSGLVYLMKLLRKNNDLSYKEISNIFNVEVKKNNDPKYDYKEIKICCQAINKEITDQTG